MNGQQDSGRKTGWEIESTIRLDKMTLFVSKDGEPRGTIVLEQGEEDEALIWLETVDRLNSVERRSS